MPIAKAIAAAALVGEGDMVVCRITMGGRHVGALGEWRPDRQAATFQGMDMHRIENGRIAETRHFERMGENASRSGR